ncbi:hypothetical protein [Pectobacterium fontis]|uniref:Uncharacterized protein n=1 Tax=Pectobacterium fontis TaxID=2558042 RepID=A0A7V8L5U5_9GAMM|nr:hypothetical protein [Pectobacterium fontis]KHN53081.1 hypothetical protein OI69_07010 [Pectobacterium fontis]
MKKQKSIRKNKISLVYNGYDLSEIMAFDMAYLINEKRSLRKSFSKLFLANELNIPSFDDDILFSIGPYGERRDYEEIINYVISQVDVKNIFRITEKSKFHFSIKGFILSINQICSQKLSFSWKNRLILLFYMMYYINTIDLLNKTKKNFKYKKYCSFCSALPLEAILCKYFKLYKITTYTLQHALYSYPKDSNVDAVIFDNMISDHLLCWGEHTKNDFLKYGIRSEKIKVCGYPSVKKDLSPYEFKETCRILLLCSSLKYEKENTEIIKIIHACSKKEKIDVMIKTHPHLNQEKYKSLAEKYGFNFYNLGTLKEALDSKEFDIAISYNSTTYYDVYMGNVLSLKYKNERNKINFDVMNDSFSTQEELLSQLKKMKELSNKSQTWFEIKKRLSIVVGYGINSYRKYL